MFKILVFNYCVWILCVLVKILFCNLLILRLVKKFIVLIVGILYLVGSIVVEINIFVLFCLEVVLVILIWIKLVLILFLVNKFLIFFIIIVEVVILVL